MAELVVAGEDRISPLPVHIIHENILPRIRCPKGEARTCVLSKTWNRIWRSRPHLRFNRNAHESCETFVKMVDDSLRPYVDQNLSIETLRLSNVGHPDLACHMDCWLNSATKLNLRCLYIFSTRYYSIPDAICAAKTLTVLWLDGCNFEIDNSTNKLQRLIGTCPLLRDITASHCTGIRNLHVAGLVHLEKLMVIVCKGLEKLEIRAPNLQTFYYEGATDVRKQRSHCEVVPVPCTIHILDGYNTLKTLKLEATTMRDEQFEYQLSKLSALEELVLKSCCLMKNIKVVSETLKRFTLGQGKILDQFLMLQAPNLKNFQLESHKLPFSTMDPSNLERAHLRLLLPPHLKCYFGDVDTSWYNNLQHFVRHFNYSKGLILVVECEEDRSILIYEDPIDILVPPTRRLSLSIMNPPTRLESFVDRLISSCPNIISIVPCRESKIVQVFHEAIPGYTKRQFRGLNEVINLKGAAEDGETPSHLYSWLKSTSLIERITTFIFKYNNPSSP